jgi:hypothetical protein
MMGCSWKIVIVHSPSDGESLYGRFATSIKYDSDGNPRCDFIETIGTYFGPAGVSLVLNSDFIPIIVYTDASEPSGLQVLKIAQPATSLGLTYGNCGPEILFQTWQCTTIDGGIYKDEAEYASFALNPTGRPMIAYSELFHEIPPYEYSLKIARLFDMLFLPIVRK